jgi:hypothetical protein
MSKWRKALKNNRRFDARYFLNERVENQETVENSVQQEEVKRNFNNFSLDSWLAEAEEAIEEAHCNSKRDDEELEEDLEEGKKSDEDGDGDIYSDDYLIKKDKAIKAAMKNEAVEEELEELQLGGDDPKISRDIKGMTPEEVALARAKAKMDLMRKASKGKPPVKKDVKKGLEESEIEEG